MLSLIISLFSRNVSQVKGAGKKPGVWFPNFPSHECRDPSLFPSVLSPLVILATSIHVRQLLEAIAPFIQVVIVLVLVWLWGVQGAQSSSFRTTSFIIKHQQRVIGWGSGVSISCLQVLKKEDNRIFYWDELHTCHFKQNTFSWWIKQNAHNTQQCSQPAEHQGNERQQSKPNTDGNRRWSLYISNERRKYVAECLKWQIICRQGRWAPANPNGQRLRTVIPG